MSSEKPARLSKTASNPAPPGDHRKRRRNRTTQSCLNCHASKRMCDRKRPACQRCTTLGLTGLCVYEVDDPSQRNNLLDEKALLRGRINELEGVIREMKNKPHPRWSQRSSSRGLPSSPVTEQEIEMANVVAANAESSPEASSSLASASSKPRPPQLTLPNIYLSPVSPVSSSSGPASSCESLLSPQDYHYLTAYNGSSPGSSLSNSPMPVHAPLPRVMVNDMPLDSSEHFSVDSLLASTHLEEGIYGRMLDHMMHADKLRYECLHKGVPGASCGCINDSLAYANVLELSARLRRAVEALGRVPDHEPGHSNCELFSRMCELDKLTSVAIGCTLSPADRLSTHPVPLLSGFPSPPIDQFPNMPPHSQPHQLSPAPALTINVHGLPPWEDRPFFESPVEDTFMSWDARQQQQQQHHQQQQRQEWSQQNLLM